MSYTQLKNYEILYDNSFNDATLNQCSAVTGGWSVLPASSAKLITTATWPTYMSGSVGVLGTLTHTNSYMQLSYAGSRTYSDRYYEAAITFANSIDSSNYDFLYFLGEGYYNTTSTSEGWGSVGYVMMGTDSFIQSTPGDSGVSMSYSEYIRTEKLFSVLNDSSKLYFVDCTGLYPAQTSYLRIMKTAYLKQDDWQTLKTKSGSSATTEDELVADLDTILSVEDAVDFMIHQCTGTIMYKIMKDSSYVLKLRLSEYSTLFYGNEHWNRFSAMFGNTLAPYINNIIIEDNPLELTLENDIALQANFELLGQPVSTIIHPADSGVTYGQGYYPEGATVNMTAVPTPTNKFLGWSNEPPQATNTLPFTMPITFASSFTPISTNPHYSFTMGASPVSLYANFGELSAKGNSKMSRRKNNTLLQKNVVVTVTGNGSVSGVGKYFPYNDCTLTATPEPNNHFVSWSDSVVTNPRTIAISTSDVSLGATFEPDRTRYTNFPQCLGTTYTAVGSYSGSTNIIASTDNPAVTFMGYYAGGGYGTEADYYYYTDALTPLIRLLNPGTGDREWWKTAISSGSSWYKLGFSKPVTFESMTAVNSTGDHLWSVNGFTVQGSNDDSTWTTITSSAFGARSQTITVALSGTYTWIRFIPTSALSGNGGSSFGTMFSFTFTATY